MIRVIIYLLLVFYGLSSGADYRDTVFVKSGWHCGENVATSCIIVRRGCDENRYPIGDFVDSKESEEQLLARVFGSEPLEDSSSIYSNWGISCSMDADVSYEGRSYLLFLSLYGIPATIGGIYLISQDYKSTAGAFLTYGVGFPLFITGGLSLFLDLITFAFTIMDSPSKMHDQAHKYWKKEEEWKLRVVPSINFEEPGGGILLQLGF